MMFGPAHRGVKQCLLGQKRRWDFWRQTAIIVTQRGLPGVAYIASFHFNTFFHLRTPPLVSKMTASARHTVTAFVIIQDGDTFVSMGAQRCVFFSSASSMSLSTELPLSSLSMSPSPYETERGVTFRSMLLLPLPLSIALPWLQMSDTPAPVWLPSPSGT